LLVSTILLLLGVPLWMIAGMLILILWNRRRVKKQVGIFPLKVRHEAESAAEKQPKWPRTGYAQWVHDVLIVRTGIGLMQSTPYGISGLETPEKDADPKEVKGLGDHPKVLRARLDDGSILQVALSEIHPELAPQRLLAEREQGIAEQTQE
jgi:hypothetical protein